MQLVRNLTENTKRNLAVCAGLLVFSFFLHLSGLPSLLLQRVIWALLLSIVFCSLCRKTDMPSFAILSGAFVTRMILGAANVMSGNVISNWIFRVGDDIVFANAAREFYYGNMAFRVNSRHFPILISYLYRIFGPDEMIAVFVMVLLAMAGCVAFYHMLSGLEISDRAVHISLAVVCFAPFSIIFSILLLREPVYFCFLPLSFLCFLHHCRGKKIYQLLAAMILCLPAIYMHWGYAAFLLVYIVYFFVGYTGNPDRKRLMILVKLVLTAVFLAFAVIVIMNSEKLKYFREAGNFTEGLILTFQKYSGLQGESNYLQDMKVTDFHQVFLYTPLRIIYFFLSPLFSDWRGWKDGLSFITDAVFPLLSCLGYICLVLRREKDLVPVHAAFWMVQLTGALYCWATISAGAAIRHRNCLIPMEMYITMRAYSGLKRKTPDNNTVL